jgi:hypothetical protein
MKKLKCRNRLSPVVTPPTVHPQSHAERKRMAQLHFEGMQMRNPTTSSVMLERKAAGSTKVGIWFNS